MDEFDADRHNEEWQENMYITAQEAIAEADYLKVQNIMKDLIDAGYVVAASMLHKEWDDAGNVDPPSVDELITHLGKQTGVK